MPVVASFNGITIEMYPKEHPPSHFHARYAEHIAQIAIQPFKVMNGSLPIPQLKRVQIWASTRQPQLLDCWRTIEEGRKPEKIYD